VCTTASKLIILGRIYAFKISGIDKGGSSEPSEPPLPTPLVCVCVCLCAHALVCVLLPILYV